VSRHFASGYIGIPWKRFGRSTDGLDCWGLVTHVLREHYEIEMADAVVDGSRTAERVRAFINYEKTSMAEWDLVDYPEDGEIVVMGNRNAVPTHCGIYVVVGSMGGGVLHCEEGIGCVFERTADVRWPRLKFYRRKP
jgi:cell wall-associated NlpC family hydrolase